MFLPNHSEVKSKLVVFTVLASALLGACSSTGSGGGGGGSGGGGGGSTSAYDATGTFTVSTDGVAATITGAIVGTYENTFTQWNGESGPNLAAAGGFPQPMTVTGTFPSGDTGSVTINLAHITAMPAAGTFNCMDSTDYQLNIVFQLFPQGGTTAVKQWAPDSTSLSSCSMVLETPTLVTETANGSSFPVYLAHGSLTATLKSIGFGSVQPDGTSGQLSLTW
jgi:hypothetical protein